MISINGQTYTSYRGVVIEGSDRVFQGAIDGLVNTAPGQTMSLDGDGYTIDTVSWQAGSVPATKVKGYKRGDAEQTTQSILLNLDSQISSWASSDPLIARLDALAGAGGYAGIIRSDIGDARDLPAIARILRRNLFDLNYPSSGGPPLLIPIWATEGSLVPVVPVGNPEYRLQGSLESAISRSDFSNQTLADAKRAAQALVTLAQEILAQRFQHTVDFLRAVTSGVMSHFDDIPDARPSGGYPLVQYLTTWIRMATGFEQAIAVNDYAILQQIIRYQWDLMPALLILLRQYGPYLGPAYANAMSAVAYDTAINRTLTARIATLLRQYGLIQRIRYAQTARQPAFDKTAFRTQYNAIVTANDQYRQVGLLLGVLLNTATATAVPVSASKTAARYLDENNEENYFPQVSAGDANVRILSGLQPNLETAQIRVLQADALAQANAGLVTLEPVDRNSAARQFSLVEADLGLPNGVRRYRVNASRLDLNGASRRLTLECSALPTAQREALPETTHFSPPRITPLRFTATRDGTQILGQRSGTAPGNHTTQLRVQAYAERGEVRLAARRRDDASTEVDNKRTATEDYLYVYRGNNWPAAVQIDTGRGATYDAAIEALFQTRTGAASAAVTVNYNTDAAGYSIVQHGGTDYLVAIVRWQCRGVPGVLSAPLLADKFDGIFFSRAPLTGEDYAIGAWATTALLPANADVRSYPILLSDHLSDSSEFHNMPQVVDVQDAGGGITTIRVVVPPYASLFPVAYDIHWSGGASQAVYTPVVDLAGATIPDAEALIARDWFSSFPTWNFNDRTLLQLKADGVIVANDLNAPFLLPIGTAAIQNATAWWEPPNAGNRRKIVDLRNRVWTLDLAAPSVAAPITTR